MNQSETTASTAPATSAHSDPLTAAATTPHPDKQYTFHSSRLTMRLPQESDLPELLEIHALDEVCRFLSYPTWTGMQDADAWYERVLTRRRDRAAVYFVVTETATGRVLGVCLVFGFQPDHCRAEIGYALGKPFWGQGFMREAVAALVDFAFSEFGLHRLDGVVVSDNAVSGRLLLSLGFTYEGMQRQARIKLGQARDMNLYGLLKSDWEDCAEKRPSREYRAKPAQDALKDCGV